MRVWVLLVAWSGACFSPRPQAGAPCSSEGECPAGLSCVDNVCTTGDEPPDAAIDAAPDAACTAICTGDMLVCGDQILACALGCDDGSARCRDIVPSNGATWEPFPAGAGSLTVPAGETWTLDSTTGLVTAPVGSALDAVITIGPDQPTLVSATAITIDGTLEVTGTVPVIFLSTGDIRIEGVLDASAGCSTDPTCPGPGGAPGADTGVSPGRCGGANGGGDAPGVDEGGGGGGGHGGSGGDGGDGSDPPTGDGGPGGATCGDPGLEPLTGGSGGGFGGTIAGVREGGRGGGGGGAVQLTSRTRATIAGVIDVNGAGGQHGMQPGGGGDDGGGGGGGAGGGILVEAPEVTITGILAANGGGGGGGLANDGQDGRRSAVRAAGGAGGTNSSAGGDGGAGMTAARPGVDGGGGGINAGGGGGGVGRIRVNARTPVLEDATISPPPSTADVKVE